MHKSLFKFNILNIINNSIIILPSPLNISMWWNIGSLLGLCLMNQIISGLILTMHYSPNINLAFNSIIHIIQDVNNGWIIRLIHLNGASLFFLFIYFHIGRGLYYNSYYFIQTWLSGTMILFILMGTAFMGYVLPWGQMSLWGATVITNLLSAIPYVGNNLVMWLWGGFSVNNATLNRFYTFHFILPFIIIFMVMIHLYFLHMTGSSNPMGLNSNFNKIPFHPYFTFKDILGFIMIYTLFMLLCLINPYILSDPENFNQANSMVTPIHIQPEWYFLFAYAILRSIPNKLGGVIALIMSIMILMFIPFINFNNLMKNLNYKFYKFNFWLLISIFIMLTLIGARPVEDPYIILGQIISIWYFFKFIYFKINNTIIDKILF